MNLNLIWWRYSTVLPFIKIKLKLIVTALLKQKPAKQIRMEKTNDIYAQNDVSLLKEVVVGLSAKTIHPVFNYY